MGRQSVFNSLLSFQKQAKKLNYENIDKDNNAAAARLLKSVLANLTYIDFHISHYSNRDLDKIDPAAMAALRIGTAELLFNKTKDYAAVSEAVDLLKGKANYLKGFVNAILRKVAKHHPVELDPNLDALDKLATHYSYPKWILDSWSQYLSTQEIEGICVANNNSSYLSLRVNTRKASRETLIDKLRPLTNDIIASDISADGILVSGLPAINSPELHDIWQDGLFYFQNIASQAVALSLSKKPVRVAVDLCSAPGGKATHLAQIFDDAIEIHAVDHSSTKLAKLAANIKRLNLTGIQPWEQSIVAEPTYELVRRADTILLDPPCSSFGVLRKAPEIRWVRQPHDMKRLAEEQFGFIRSISEQMQPGTTLVYSVCTFTKEETLDVLRRVQEEVELLKHVAIDHTTLEEGAKPYLVDGCFHSLPQEMALDGHFVAHFVRI